MSNVTREHLFEEIWTEPMTTVAKRYGVSSNYLARICERLKVPRPPRGYWAKVKGAKTVRRAVLPPARPSDERVWRTSGYGLVLPEQPLSVGTVDAPGQHKKKYVRGELHVLVRGAKEKFDRAGHDAEGYLRPEGPEVPDILVAKTTVKRALAFANALFLALEARGHDVVLAPRDRTFVTCGAGLPDEGQSRWHGRPRWRPRRATLVFVGEVAVGLTLAELNEDMPAQRLWDQNVWVRDTRRPSERDDRLSALRTWLPNGRLRVRAYSPYPMTTWSQDWLDAETKLEAQIDAIVTGIEAGACALPALIVTARQEYDEHRRKLAEEQRAWEIRQAREAYERATAASHEALLQMTHEWSQAEEIRRFLEAAEDDLVHVPDAVRAALAAKLKQARAMLGSQRPIDQLAAWTPPPRDPAR